MYANAVWSAFFTTAAFLAILFGIAAAMLRHGRARAFWVGFAVFGAGYFALVTYSKRDENNAAARLMRQWGWQQPQITQTAEPQLVTSIFLIWADQHLRPMRAQAGPANLVTAPDGTLVRTTRQPIGLTMRGNVAGINFEFVTIGHAIFTVLFALAGGFLGSWIYRRESPRASDQDATSP
jgi:hypothetical protein